MSMAAEEKVQKEQVSAAFKFFHATSANGTAMLMSAVVSSYFSVFMTDTMNIPAAAGSMIMFVATLIDAVSNPVIGVVADRTNTRWGRYRPYFLAAPILLTLFSVLIWFNPDLSPTGKIIWVLVSYIGFSFTMSLYTMPHMAILPACVRDDITRNSIITLGAGFTAAMFTIGSTFTPNIKSGLERIFQTNNGYIPMMVICGLLSFISFWGLFATAKEKYLSDNSKRGSTEDLKTVLRHTELIPYIIIWIMACMGYGLMFSSSVYYVMYYLERPDLISLYMGVISVGAMVSMMVLMPLALKIFKTGQRALLFTQIGAVICYALLFLAGGKSLSLVLIVSFIATAIASMSNALVNVLVNDAIDYIQLKEGISANGVISSIKSFAQKCGNTVVSSGILAVLAMTGYVAGAVGGQPKTALFAINFLRFGAPAFIGVIMIFCLRFNPVDKCRNEIEKMKRNM